MKVETKISFMKYKYITLIFFHFLLTVFSSCKNDNDLKIYRRALYYNDNEMYDKTILLTRNYKLDVPNLYILKELAYAYFFTNEFNKSDEIINEILKYDTNNIFALYMKAMLHKENGDHIKAIEYFNKVIIEKGGEISNIDRKGNNNVFNEASFDIEMVIVRFFRGESEFIIGMHKDAYKDFTYCINNGHDLSNSYYYRSVILWKSGEIVRACDDFSFALKCGFIDDNNLRDSICFH